MLVEVISFKPLEVYRSIPTAGFPTWIYMCVYIYIYIYIFFFFPFDKMNLGGSDAKYTVPEKGL